MEVDGLIWGGCSSGVCEPVICKLVGGMQVVFLFDIGELLFDGYYRYKNHCRDTKRVLGSVSTGHSF